MSNYRIKCAQCGHQTEVRRRDYRIEKWLSDKRAKFKCSCCGGRGEVEALKTQRTKELQKKTLRTKELQKKTRRTKELQKKTLRTKELQKKTLPPSPGGIPVTGSRKVAGHTGRGARGTARCPQCGKFGGCRC